MLRKTLIKFTLVQICFIFNFYIAKNAEATIPSLARQNIPQSILVQENGVMVSLASAVASANGTISQIGGKPLVF